ncbi:14948_t:CDS:2 [Cetraspora pellucida]|uniref:14948_t:CDS:1 n=1 Tax=Cetraspora pellucida TaxID=1433469 RepID=A0A9N9FRH3_9GLOM|nr:14948_t:CDS:2 [Cetraspora pellucida]
MSGFDIVTIIDKKDKTLPKPYINHFGFNIKYAVSYISHYGKTYANKLNQIFNNKRLFDTLSTIKQNETSKLIKIDNVNPKKLFHFTRQRKARIIQIAYQNYKNRSESLATQAWNAIKNNGTSDDEKFLGLTRCEMKILRLKNNLISGVLNGLNYIKTIL